MTHSKFLLALLGTALLSACGPTQVVITAELGADDPSQASEPRALSDLEIRMFPYNRDAIFDSLTAAATTPEPPIPDSVLDAQNQVAAAQQAWRDSEARWNVLRDTLQTLTAELEQLSRASAQYRLLVGDWNDLDDEYVSVERQRDAAFENFTSLQAASMTAAAVPPQALSDLRPSTVGPTTSTSTKHANCSGRLSRSTVEKSRGLI